jgi:hypothetical protein
MSSSVAPLFPKTSVFIPAYWENARSEILTQEEADARYLKFPVGQGTESIPNLIVSGTSTLGITSASTLTASTQVNINTDSNYALNIGAGTTTSTGNMLLQIGSINRFTTDPNNKDISICSYNNSGAGNQRGEVVVSSGTNSTSSQALMNAFSRDNYNTSLCYCKETITDFQLFRTDGEVDSYSGFRNFLNASQYATAMMYSIDAGVGYCAIRIPQGENSIQMFLNSNPLATTNIASFSTSNNIFYSPIQFNSTNAPCGVVEKSTILTASTTGNYTMTSANSYLTTINTPTANRNFILPAPSGLITGQWFGICNKSTSFTIAVQYPSGTTIFTIPVASNAGGGSSARFAVDSALTAYFRCG